MSTVTFGITQFRGVTTLSALLRYDMEILVASRDSGTTATAKVRAI